MFHFYFPLSLYILYVVGTSELMAPAMTSLPNNWRRKFFGGSWFIWRFLGIYWGIILGLGV